MSTNPEASLPPGFRFHPTDEELIHHYLRNRTASLPCPADVIAEVDIYKFNPWDLPAKAGFGDKEWYFFTPRDRKYPNGIRPNRAAASGYWKATGTDKPIVASTGPGAGRINIGVKKALVFYRGKPPKGRKTSWIMHEYRLADRYLGSRNTNLHFCRRPVQDKDASMRLDDWVLCRIYKKPTGMQRTLTDQEEQHHQREHEDDDVDEEEERKGRGGGGGECNNVVGDSQMPTLPSTIYQQSNCRLLRPPSLTELVQNADMLSYLLSDNPPDQAAGGFDLSSSRLGQQAYAPVHTTHVSNSSGGMDRNGIITMASMDQHYHHPIPYQAESTHMSMASRLGSSRQDDAGGLLLNQSKDCGGGGPTNLNPHIFNNLKQPYINHNLLWNPHLGLH